MKESPVANPPPVVESAAQKKRDELMTKSMSRAGLDEQQIEKFNSYADMVGSGFSKTVDYCYGVMVVGTMLLEERTKYIEEEVLQNEDEITHHRFSAQHGHVTWEGPRYSSEIKLEFQKEWISIMEQLGKYAGIA